MHLAALQKLAHAIYSNFLEEKNENILVEKLRYFNIVAQNIDCVNTLESPHGGGSNEYPQSMF